MDDYLASILKASKPPPIRLDIPGLENPVYIRKMSGYDGSVFAKKMAGRNTDDDLYSGYLLAALMVRENGEDLIDMNNVEGVTMLAQFPKDIQWAIASAHSEHNNTKTEESKN